MLDIASGEYPVRIINLDQPTAPPLFEGTTAFTVTPLPRLRGRQAGPRYRITATAWPHREWQSPNDYRDGADMIEDGYYACLLLDRWQPPPGLDALAEHVARTFGEMGITGIRWE